MIKNSPLPPCPGDERSKRLLGRKSTGTTPVNSDVWPSIGVRPRGSAGLDKNGREIRFWPNTRPQGTRQRCQSSGWKRKSHLVWQQGRLSSLLCNGDLMNTKKSKFTPPQPTNPLWANGKKCSAIRQKTNIIISSGFISRLPGLQGPSAFQDNSGAESWEKSAAKPERKQRRQRRTFVLARKTTRDRLTEEKSSCVQQREKEGIRCREGGRVYCPPYWWG